MYDFLIFSKYLREYHFEAHGKQSLANLRWSKNNCRIYLAIYLVLKLSH